MTTEDKQMTHDIAAVAAGLLPCRECGEPCSLQVIDGTNVQATLWMCANHKSLGGDCPSTTAYLSEEAWNQYPEAPDPIPISRADLVAVLEALEELADLMDDVVDGDYTPDSFTVQPARTDHAKIEGWLK